MNMKPIVERIGMPALLEQTAEECTELAHACLKEARRLRGENPTPCTEEECYSKIVAEEADVQNCMRRLSEAGYMWARGDVEDKLDRWHQRLDRVGK